MIRPDNELVQKPSLLLQDGETYDAPENFGPALLRFKAFKNVTDIRLIPDNERVGYVNRNLSRAECEEYANGFMAGQAHGHKLGMKAQSRIVTDKLNLTL